MKNFFWKCSFHPKWDYIKKIRKKVYFLVKKIDASIAEETKLVASELCENAVKYSNAIEKNKIFFEIKIDSDNITIAVTSNFITDNDVNQLTNEIEQINSSENPEKFYKDRLLFIIENKCTKNSKLGIYRIAYETKYKLNYQLYNSSIKVIATRNLKKVERKSYAAF